MRQLVAPLWRRVFDAGAGGYDLLTRQRYWRRQVLRVLDHAGGRPRRILDLGCGPGGSALTVADELGAGTTIVGLDISHAMVSRAAAHARTRAAKARPALLVGDARRLPFSDGCFDLAVGHSFLYLVPDRAGVLREVRRVLRPGGRLVLMEPDVRGWLPIAAVRSLPRAGALLEHPCEALRFAASMVTWRLLSSAAGQLEAASVKALLQDAGFRRAACHPTLAGLGMHCVGEA